MASLRNLKKGINYLVDEVIGTCMLHKYARGQQEHEELDQLIHEMVEYRESLLNRVNNPELEDKGRSMKAYYRGLLDELLEKVNSAFDKVNATAN